MLATRRIFVGSSSEALTLAGLIGRVISDAGMTPIVWNIDAFPPGRTLLEQIESLPYEFDGAVFIATPDVSCRRRERRYAAPVANVIFEYGYLSARLTRDRVAICRFLEADMPSDILGVKLIEGRDIEYNAIALPKDMVSELSTWLGRHPKLAEGTSPTVLLHGYSGRWNIQNRFEIWHGLQIERPDRVYFDGTATLSIPATGSGGTGMMYGATHISLGDYRARLEVVNEIRDAVVGKGGELKLRIAVVRRHLAQESGKPPNGQFREDLQSKEFEVRLESVPGQPKELRGVHTYTQATDLYSSAVERYVLVD